MQPLLVAFVHFIDIINTKIRPQSKLQADFTKGKNVKKVSCLGLKINPKTCFNTKAFCLSFGQGIAIA